MAGNEHTEATAPQERSVEEIAQTAYAIVAEELKEQGDFPPWDAITDRARQSYIEGVEHVQQALAAAKPRTRFEKIVLEVLQ